MTATVREVTKRLNQIDKNRQMHSVTKGAKVMGKCGAKKRGGGKCQLAKGYGTNHPGIGNCKFHGGSVPNHVKAAAQEEYRMLLGKPLEINPFDAILWCIRIRAGEVQWLTERMAELQEKAWVEQTIAGKQFHLFARERHAAMNDLARFSNMAVSLGIAERSVRLAEQYGELLYRLFTNFINDPRVPMTKVQKEVCKPVFREHLIALSSQPKELAAGESADAERTAA